MRVIKNIISIFAIFLVIFLVIVYQNNQFKSKNYDVIYDVSDSLEVFLFDRVPYGFVMYIQGIESTKDTTLSFYKYRTYEVGILNPDTRAIFKIHVPVYAIMMFQIGKESKPKELNKEQKNPKYKPKDGGNS